MSTIQLTDQFGLDLDVTAPAVSALEKYFSNLSSLSLTGFNLKSIADLTLADPAVTTLTGGLNFDQPVTVGSGGVTLQFNAGASGSLKIFVPPATGGNLFDPDQFGDNISVAPAQRYVSVTLNATAGPQINATENQLCFGFQAGASVTLANYRLFETQPACPTIAAAVEDTIANFSVPGSLGDLQAMAPGAVVSLDGAGTVTYSGGASLAATPNPLATFTLPDSLPALDISAGGSVAVAASFAIDWDYQLRVSKVDANTIHLGVYHKKGDDTSVSVTVSGGVTAGVGSTDFLSMIMSAVLKGATVNSSSLTAMGVPQAQIDGIQSAVKASVQRKLQVALTAALTDCNSQDAAFLYEIDLASLDQTGTAAVAAALRGDLSGLSGAAPAGIRALRDSVGDLSQKGVTWKINLLGIYNYISTSELVRQGSMLFDPATGDLTLTDTATAKSVSASTVAFGADTNKLRGVLAQSLLVTAAYRGSQAIVSAPELKCSHSFFELNAATNADTMQGELDVAAALGLLDLGQEQTLLNGAADFGQTMTYAETSYDDALATSLFLNGSAARSQSDFETAGRQSIALLVRPGAVDDYRLRPATDDALWANMSSAGQPNFAPLFPDLTPLQVQVISSDYTVIMWWAEAMGSCAQRLAAMRAQVAANPDPSSPQFQALRAALTKQLAQVASQTQDQFGQPWGLIAMDRASGSQAGARVQITGSRVSLSAARTTAAATLAAGAGS
jgi:hypothetical protein